MSGISSTTQQDKPSDLAYRRFYRACLALCILVAPVVLFLGFAVDPTGGLGVPANLAGVASEINSVNSFQVQLFLYLNAVTVYFFPLSFIGLGLLAIRRSPWFALIGVIAGLAGSLPFSLFPGLEALAFTVASNPSEIVIYQSVTSQGSVFMLAASWVVGHLIGYVVTGIALLRSKAIPRWAASLFIMGIPLQAAGYGAGLNILQLICFALIFIGSIPAARAMIKSDL